jgi:hypothetical protein
VKKLIAVVLATAFIAAVCLIAVPVVLLTTFTTVMSSTLNGAAGICVENGSPALSVDPAQLPDNVEGMRAEQLSNAAIIMKAGEDAGLGERAQLIGLMTAMQESTLNNLSGGDRDSVGLFQQRPSQGWGTVEQLTDQTYAARAFFQGVDAPDGSHIPGLADLAGWESMTLTEAAQAVQASAYPDAYAKHEAKARKIMAALAGVPVSEASNDLTNNMLGCGVAALNPGLTIGGLVGSALIDGLPTQAQLKQSSAQVACPEGTVDLGAGIGGVDGRKVPIRLCSIPGTVCTGSDCGKGQLGGKARGEVVVNSLVAPYFINWLGEVRATGHDPQFSSSFRSWESQQRISRGGSNPNAARPGHSNHQMGAAVDISGLPGSYNKHNCAGTTPDGSCKASSPAWEAYWTHAIANGAAFHDQEFWHLEWIITRADQRNVPFIN